MSNFYRSINPSFWSGKTGKAIRGNPEAQVLALYLITNQHTNMQGVYHLPVAYICADTGLSQQGALKGLDRLFEGGFCEYFHEQEVVFVYKMLVYQTGNLKKNDNRAISVRNFYNEFEEGHIKQRFAEHYWDLLDLEYKPLASPSEAPRVSVAVTEAVAVTETGERHATKVATPKGSRLPDDWQPTDEMIAYCKTKRPDLDYKEVAENFRDWWIAQPGQKGVKRDWSATWRTWVRGERRTGKVKQTAEPWTQPGYHSSDTVQDL